MPNPNKLFVIPNIMKHSVLIRNESGREEPGDGVSRLAPVDQDRYNNGERNVHSTNKIVMVPNVLERLVLIRNEPGEWDPEVGVTRLAPVDQGGYNNGEINDNVNILSASNFIQQFIIQSDCFNNLNRVLKPVYGGVDNEYMGAEYYGFPSREISKTHKTYKLR